MVQVIIIGNIDLSVGSVVAFVGAISAMLYNTGIGMVATVIISIIIGVLIGAFQGLWIAYLKIPAFIATLAGMLLFRGLTYIITNVTPIALKDDGFKGIASGMANIPSLDRGDFYITALIVGLAVFVLYLISELQSRNNKIKHQFEVSPMSVVSFKNDSYRRFDNGLELEIRYLPGFTERGNRSGRDYFNF